MGNSEQAEKILDIIPKCMRCIRAEMRAIEDSDLSIPQFRILVYLAKNEVSTNKDLANWLGVTTPTMTRMIDLLVKRNLVERVQNSKDRREIQLKITKEGRKKYLHRRSKVQDNLAKKVSGLSLSQQDTLIQGLQILEDIFS